MDGDDSDSERGYEYGDSEDDAEDDAEAREAIPRAPLILGAAATLSGKNRDFPRRRRIGGAETELTATELRCVGRRPQTWCSGAFLVCHYFVVESTDHHHHPLCFSLCFFRPCLSIFNSIRLSSLSAFLY